MTMATQDEESNDESQPCADQCADCWNYLRVVRQELDRERAWLEARALHLDDVVGHLDLFLEERQHSSIANKRRTAMRRSRTSSRTDVILSTAVAVQRSDGYWEIRLDTLPQFELPPLLGRLFALLANDRGCDVGDGLVGFKSNAHLLNELRRLSVQPDSAPSRTVARFNARGLAQAVYDLRGRLARFVVHGDALVQTRRSVGRRVPVRKPTQTIETDSR
jgi:hypothetical protein